MSTNNKAYIVYIIGLLILNPTGRDFRVGRSKSAGADVGLCARCVQCMRSTLPAVNSGLAQKGIKEPNLTGQILITQFVYCIFRAN